MPPRVDGVLLRRQPKRVIAKRVEHVMPHHAQKAGINIGRDIAKWMTHMQTRTARVREHIHDHELRVADDLIKTSRHRPNRVRGAESPGSLPIVLPSQLDLIRHPSVITEPKTITLAGPNSAAHIRSGHTPSIPPGIVSVPADGPATIAAVPAKNLTGGAATLIKP